MQDCAWSSLHVHNDAQQASASRQMNPGSLHIKALQTGRPVACLKSCRPANFARLLSAQRCCRKLQSACRMHGSAALLKTCTVIDDGHQLAKQQPHFFTSCHMQCAELSTMKRSTMKFLPLPSKQGQYTSLRMKVRMWYARGENVPGRDAARRDTPEGASGTLGVMRPYML